jgi:hypothetical protein
LASPHWIADGLGYHTFVWNVLPSRISVCATSEPLSFKLTNFTFISRHLLGTGRGDEARKVVAELNGIPEDDLLVIEIVEELDFAIRAENEGGKATWLECFSTRNALWRRTINGMMLQFIQQLNGQNFYCKIPHADSILVTTIMAIVNTSGKRNSLQSATVLTERSVAQLNPLMQTTMATPSFRVQVQGES